MNLYGVSEIAAATGDRRDTVSQWVFRGKLPPPDFVLEIGKVWLDKTIEPWIRNRVKEKHRD